MAERESRVDKLGRAYAGSQLQIQIYVNRRAGELTRRILDCLPSLASLKAPVRWVSPLEEQRFIEYQDRASLQALGLEHLAGPLSRFWPRGGPIWDALAIVEIGGDLRHRGAVLVEAKSHPSEIYGGGCRASPKSRRKIEAALEQTKRWLGVPRDVDWTGPLYQSANRLAHLYFLSKVVGVPAWLVNVYFMGDSHSPTSREEFGAALGKIKAELGLTGIVVPHAADLFLKARERRELIGGTKAKP